MSNVLIDVLFNKIEKLEKIIKELQDRIEVLEG